ncbi:MAG: helix-hairpin-helix domain-containing protein [Anaerolineae bacterium]|jgi:competence ComEA-like helix-hairpin-helix protein
MNEQEQEELAQGQEPQEEVGGSTDLEAMEPAAEPAADLEVMHVDAPRIDVNTATEEELRQLPGIGGALASRIVSYRKEAGPFGSPEEITSVSGVAGATYDKLADRLTAGPVEPLVEEAGDLPEPETELEDVEAEESEDIPVLMSEPSTADAEPAESPEPEPEAERVAEVPPVGAEPPLVELVESRAGCGRLILVGALSALLGAVLALALIFVINGTLDFQSAAVRAAEDQVLRIESVVGALDMKVGELEERLGAIQELDARLTETQTGLRRLSAGLDELGQRADALAETQGVLQQEFSNLRQDTDGMAAQVSMLERRLSDTETQIAYLNRRIEILAESIQRFDEFLSGLQALLNQSLDTAAPTPTPWVTPVNAPSATPTAWETRVPRPQVTVIPLATPTP